MSGILWHMDSREHCVYDYINLCRPQFPALGCKKWTSSPEILLARRLLEGCHPNPEQPEKTQVRQKSDKSEHEENENYRIPNFQFYSTSQWQVAASGLSSSFVLPPFATSQSHPLLLKTKRAGRVTQLLNTHEYTAYYVYILYLVSNTK